jgi:hypothetical protein
MTPQTAAHLQLRCHLLQALSSCLLVPLALRVAMQSAVCSVLPAKLAGGVGAHGCKTMGRTKLKN